MSCLREASSSALGFQRSRAYDERQTGSGEQPMEPTAIERWSHPPCRLLAPFIDRF